MTTNTTETVSYERLVDRIAGAFARAAQELSIVPATPREHHHESALKHRAWDSFKDEICELLAVAYQQIPGDLPEGASSRTALLEVAIREMTEKLIQYPSSPYTLTSTESLGNTITALKTSMEIDEMNRKEDEHA
jgi:hypothetical protein